MEKEPDIIPEDNHNHKKIFEIAIILAVSIVIYMYARTYDILELIVKFSWKHENLEIDEFLTVTFFISFALLFILIRRWKDLKTAYNSLQQQSKYLQKALSEIKQLRGIIPICASCKKIRDDEGYWHQVEVYISEHSDASFSHGICPDCLKKLYPEYVKE